MKNEESVDQINERIKQMNLGLEERIQAAERVQKSIHRFFTFCAIVISGAVVAVVLVCLARLALWIWNL